MLTGAAEAPLAYFAYAAVGASWAIRAPLYGLVKDGLVHVYVPLDAMREGRAWCFRQSPHSLEQRFERWQRVWEKRDGEFYRFATGKNFSWNNAWRRLDAYSFSLFRSAYHIEWFDPFAKEIETLIRSGMQKAHIPVDDLSAILLPNRLTMPQRLAVDVVGIKQGKSWKQFSRKYWYFLGHWAGGDMLVRRSQLRAMQASSGKSIEERKIFQKERDQKLDADTRHYVQLLRLFALWREERKSYLQRISLAYQNVLHVAARTTGVRFDDLLWLSRVEARNGSTVHNIVDARKCGEVQVALPNSRAVHMVTGAEAEGYFTDFLGVRTVSELHGTSAFSGKHEGVCRIIIRPDEFGKFRKGEILVTTMTRPEFVPLMRRAKAIVTDEGGLTSHAAILARELHIPCVVGTGDATRVLKTGDRVFVDATKGLVRKI